jgi:hypothetical protein
MPDTLTAEVLLETAFEAQLLRRRARDARGLADDRRRRAAAAMLGGQRRYAEGLADGAAWLEALAARDEARLAAVERSQAEVGRGDVPRRTA